MSKTPKSNPVIIFAPDEATIKKTGIRVITVTDPTIYQRVLDTVEKCIEQGRDGVKEA